MAFTEDDLKHNLSLIGQQGKKALETLTKGFEEHYAWLQSVHEGLKNGAIKGQVLVPKTPGKQRVPLSAITESLETTFESEDVHSTRSSNQIKKNTRASKRAQTKKPGPKSKKAPIIVDDDSDDNVALSQIQTKKGSKIKSEMIQEEIENSCPSNRQKRPWQSSSLISHQEEPEDTASKRLCGNRASATTSRDSGLSSVGSRNTRGSTLNGAPIKQEILTPKNMSVDSTASALREEDKSLISNDGSSESTPVQTFVAEELAPDSPQPETPSNIVQSPVVKAPPPHLLKGESVKKTVEAFEALNEVHEKEAASMAPPIMPPPSKTALTCKIPQPTAPSLDEALNAPTRVTRTKTRAMAKAAAADKTTHKDEQDSSAVSDMFKSPVKQIQQQHQAQSLLSQQKTMSSTKTLDKRLDDFYEKESSLCSASKGAFKLFGSASKQPILFLKGSTPLNRINPLVSPPPSSFLAPRNIVTSVDSFILKPVVHHEIKPSREENLQKLAAKAEVASKKKEEIMKAQMEEKIKKRQEKMLKVCAAREAKEKEKLEMQLRLEREREEKQKQLLAEREEKLRQEHLKKKRLAQQKAAETEERRRQEEAARLAKLRQQEEEQKRIAAQRKREQEEAERKQMERIQQEREAAAFRAMEAERLAKEASMKAKEASLKAKEASKPLLDQTYDKLPQPPLSCGKSPQSEKSQPLPKSTHDNYGIDDVHTDDSSEDESKPKKAVPLWAQPKQRMPKLLDDYEINHRQMFVFFGSKKSTPDLSKIFTAIDRRQLIRKSSAVWHTPPVKY